MTKVVRALLIANIAVFFIEKTQPGFVNAFIFYPPLAFYRPWTIVTYMFLHDPNGWSHILFNMIALYFFGPRVEERIGSRHFAIMYFLSGIAGALLSMALSFNAPILGASAGVFGVMMAFAYFWPDTPIYMWGLFPIPAAALVVVTTILALAGGFIPFLGGNIAHFAHLGGYAGAFLYLKWLGHSRQAFRRKATAGPRPSDPRVLSWKSIDVQKVHEVNRAELNRILDKIGKSGVGSLTEQERLFLSNFVPTGDRVPPVS